MHAPCFKPDPAGSARPNKATMDTLSTRSERSTLKSINPRENLLCPVFPKVTCDRKLGRMLDGTFRPTFAQVFDAPLTFGIVVVSGTHTENLSECWTNPLPPNIRSSLRCPLSFRSRFAAQRRKRHRKLKRTFRPPSASVSHDFGNLPAPRGRATA